MRTRITFFMAIFFIASAAFSQTTVPGGDVSGLWTTFGSPYLIEGDIYVQEGETLEIRPGVEVIFQRNYLLEVHGFIDARGTESDSILFTCNFVDGHRGIRILGDTTSPDSMYFTYCIFKNGSATGSFPYDCAGALGIDHFDNVRIEHCLFQDNQALSSIMACGGAIATSGFNGIIRYNTFTNNKAQAGGAIILWNYSNPLVSHNLFYDNEAVYYGGAIDLWDFSDPLIINNTIVSNHTGISGAGLRILGTCSPTLINNIFWDNTSNEGSPQIYIDDDIAAPDFFYNDIQYGLDSIGTYGGFPLNGQWRNNIDADPLFVDPEAGDFTITCGTSPCIDAGCDTIFDPDGTICDIGKFYCNQTGINDEPYRANELDLSIYPNPCRDQCKIGFRVQGTGYRAVSLSVVDLTGQVVDSPVNAFYPAGEHLLEYDASALPSGIYFFRLQIGDETVATRVIKN